jgi:hypothetical protein
MATPHKSVKGDGNCAVLLLAVYGLWIVPYAFIPDKFFPQWGQILVLGFILLPQNGQWVKAKKYIFKKTTP